MQPDPLSIPNKIKWNQEQSRIVINNMDHIMDHLKMTYTGIFSL